MLASFDSFLQTIRHVLQPLCVFYQRVKIIILQPELPDILWNKQRVNTCNKLSSRCVRGINCKLPGEHRLANFENATAISFTLMSLFSSRTTGGIFCGWLLRTFSNIMFSCILLVTNGESSGIFTNAAPRAFDQDQIGGRLPWKRLAASISWLSVMEAGIIIYRDRLQEMFTLLWIDCDMRLHPSSTEQLIQCFFFFFFFLWISCIYLRHSLKSTLTVDSLQNFLNFSLRIVRSNSLCQSEMSRNKRTALSRLL